MLHQLVAEGTQRERVIRALQRCNPDHDLGGPDNTDTARSVISDIRDLYASVESHVPEQVGSEGTYAAAVGEMSDDDVDGIAQEVLRLYYMTVTRD